VSGLGGRTILAVFAHPDDESLACGGTLLRLADEGARVVLICASHGERGSVAGPVLDDELGRTRSRELRDAAAALGIADVLILDHPDGNLRWAGVSELHAQIVMALRQYTPAAVITFGEDGLYWHLDHIGVHERATTAVESLGAAAPPLYYVTMPQGVMRGIVDSAVHDGWTAPLQGFWSLVPDAFGDGANPPTIVVNVEAWVPRKLAAIHCHRSQMGASQPLAQIGETEARRWLGVEHFRRAPDGASNDPVLEELGDHS
jgi:LmbE family N-acetylglucosaminyl deacetylase